MTGKQLKDGGTRLVSDNNKAWIDAVFSQLESLCIYYDEFTADDLRVVCALRGLSEPGHRNAWGAVFARAAREKLIRHVRYQRSDNPTSRSRVVAVWRKA